MALVGQSEARLVKAHPDLAQLFRVVATVWDVNILESVRSPERQRELFAAGKSKTLQSKHLLQSDGFAWAVDAAPDPVDWRDTGRFYYFGGYVRRVAEETGFKIRYGGDWDGDYVITDQDFNDLVHWEKLL